MAEDAGKSAVGARVGRLRAKRAIGRHAAEVGVHRNPPVLHRGLHILLVHHRVHRAGGMPVLGDDNVEQRLDGVAMPRRRDLRDGSPLEIAERILERADDEDARATTRFVVEALHPARIDHLIVQLGTGRRIAQPNQERVPPTALRPHRNAGVE